MTDADFIANAIAFMHPDDCDQLFVPSSTRESMPLVPNYSLNEMVSTASKS